MEPTREIYWNIGHVWVMYALLAPTVAAFGYGIARHVRCWRRGRPTRRLDAPLRRILWLILDGLAQRKLFRRLGPGLTHASYFWSFLLLVVGTTLVAVQVHLHVPILYGRFYLVFQSLTLDLAGLVAIVGLSLAAWHRYVTRPRRLRTSEDKAEAYDHAVVLGLLLLLMVQGFLVEGLRIVGTRDPWAAWSPVGSAAGRLLLAAGLPETSVPALHRWAWWTHLATAFAFIAYMPYSPKLFHILTAPLNAFLRPTGPIGVLALVDLTGDAPLGVSRLEDFTWKDLFDLDACTKCGRCDDACPAFNTNKPLSPKALILDLKASLHGRPISLWDGDPGTKPPGEVRLVGDVIHNETLWACTTCYACVQECPVFIEHVPKILEMRRSLVMEQSPPQVPAGVAEALRGLEMRGHPFRGTGATRTTWTEGLGVPVAAGLAEFDVLYWVGCATALEPRAQGVARAFARLLRRARVRFAILGDEERCSGDPARRLGSEYLFETLARANVATLHRYGVRRIVTTCPHCYNSLKNDYVALGGRYDVEHHSTFLARLIREGRLRTEARSGRQRSSVTYHDPCYLARYNRVTEEPRALLEALPGAEVREMHRCRDRTFCCGAGGGLYWMEERIPPRVSHVRTDEALGTGAAAIATACPFCLQMLEDGVRVKGRGGSVVVRDVAELLEAAACGPGGGGESLPGNLEDP